MNISTTVSQLQLIIWALEDNLKNFADYQILDIIDYLKKAKKQCNITSMKRLIDAKIKKMETKK